ncbi:unnamed protein product [Rotaria sp. Silwood2]|nr:unnamed protein product [Rotaria sp. Silwood2]CAF2952528.1 unnamed protein product [Rotaria sp. Silwood2]CAF3321129.1 unnamed protein product [Rotaria sp. Silwood2]CAF4169415.1 unnamed protein product [Rotaria sp. Silwood2]
MGWAGPKVDNPWVGFLRPSPAQPIRISDTHSHILIFTYNIMLIYYDNITNNFPARLFKFVVQVCLHDEHLFEHEFFLQIPQPFPFIKELTVVNRKLQNNKLHNDNEGFSIIKYPYLTTICRIEAHDDYIE